MTTRQPSIPNDAAENLTPATIESPAAFAERIHSSRSHVYVLMQRGMPSVKIGRCRRIDPEAAMRWIYEQSDADA